MAVKAIELEYQGQLLRGMHHDVNSKEVVIMFHGLTGNKAEYNFYFVYLSRLLEKEGIDVFRFDFLGSGESDGKFEDMTFSSQLDNARTIFTYVKSLNYTKIKILGFSYGAAVAGVLSKDFAEDINKMVLWAPAGFTLGGKQRQKHLTKAYKDGYDIGGLVYGRNHINELKTIDAYEGIEVYKNPVLLIHGSNDFVVPEEQVIKYQEYWKTNSEYLVIDGANHLFNTMEQKDILMNSTVNFLK